MTPKNTVPKGKQRGRHARRRSTGTMQPAAAGLTGGLLRVVAGRLACQLSGGK
jgi:hypothetical protein